MTESTNQFASHPIFNIDGLDWLSQHLTAKSAKLEAGYHNKAGNDYSLWQERCGCIVMIDSPPAKALCSLLIWGNEKRAFDIVHEHLTHVAFNELRNQELPKGCVHNRKDLARRMAYMVWALYLWNSWDCYTVKGKLLYAGIKIHDRTYKNQMSSYHKTLICKLQQLAEEIDEGIRNYRKSLKEYFD